MQKENQVLGTLVAQSEHLHVLKGGLLHVDKQPQSRWEAVVLAADLCQFVKALVDHNQALAYSQIEQLLAHEAGRTALFPGF